MERKEESRFLDNSAITLQPDRDSKKLIVWPRLRKEKTGMSSADLLETEIQSSADSCLEIRDTDSAIKGTIIR